ncbi:MAG: cysteine--tRNA ligase [Patescibacteria group bacterium]
MLKLYDSFTKEKQAFKPRRGRTVTMYNCGPTVYDFVHIGNLRYFIFTDVLRRYLEYSGYRVKQVMNITDVGHTTTDGEGGEDKVEAAARKRAVSPKQITEEYTKAFFADLRSLGVKRAWKYPRATRHVRDMLTLIAKLIQRGHAYVVSGSVYYDLDTFPKYGMLSGNKVSDLIPGARVEVIAEKRHPYDFALWIRNPAHLMQWSAPWGKGYPGWHIECSAMAMRYLGATLDIHTGGEDNKFPHHECEIAQSEGATGKQFARYWLHVAHLLVDGEKMSKSKGNYYILAELLKRGFSAKGGSASGGEPRAVRYLLISAHYRDALNFTFDSLAAAAGALRRLDEFWAALRDARSGRDMQSGLRRLVQETREEFVQAMDDDLNTPKALGLLFTFVRNANPLLRTGVAASELKEAQRLVADTARVFGLTLRTPRASAVPAEVKKLLAEREDARAASDWAHADAIRKEIEVFGYTVEDTPEGQKVKRKA